MELEEALRDFAGADESRKDAAFGLLCATSRARLHHRLRRCLPDHQDREDVIQVTFLQIWEMRTQFVDRGLGAWHTYLYRALWNTAIDMLRRRKPHLSIWELAAGQPEAAPASLPDPADLRRLYQIANLIWLQLNPDLPPDLHDRQLLAARLHYLESVPWEELLMLLPPYPGQQPLTRATLDDWLEHPGVLRYLAFDTLYCTGAELTAHLLGVPDACGATFARWMRLSRQDEPEEPAPADLDWRTVRVVLQRFYYGLSVDAIVERSDPPLSEGFVQEISDRFTAQFPFSHQMQTLCTALRRLPGQKGIGCLAEPGLWQRLAFQYRYAEDLPMRDVRERIVAPAQVVGYKITPAMIQMWFSSERLLKRFMKHVQGE